MYCKYTASRFHTAATNPSSCHNFESLSLKQVFHFLLSSFTCQSVNDAEKVVMKKKKKKKKKS